MSNDLVNLAQRWPERAATHYDGCEADHVGCLVKKLAREVERLTAERDADTGRNHLRKVVELFETHFADDPSGKYRPLAYPFYEAAVKQVAVALEAAQAESERLRIDAARYQWLRNSQTRKSVGCIEFGPYGALLNGPELDAAVDRGMLASAADMGGEA